MLHFWINEWEASKSALVHGIDQAFLAVWETRFLTQKLPIEVTAVIWSFLQLDKTRKKFGKHRKTKKMRNRCGRKNIPLLVWRGAQLLYFLEQASWQSWKIGGLVYYPQSLNGVMGRGQTAVCRHNKKDKCKRSVIAEILFVLFLIEYMCMYTLSSISLVSTVIQRG